MTRHYFPVRNSGNSLTGLILDFPTDLGTPFAAYTEGEYCLEGLRYSQFGPGIGINSLEVQNSPSPVAVTWIFSRRQRRMHCPLQQAEEALRWRGPAIRGKKKQKTGTERSRNDALPLRPPIYFVCDKRTGVPHFHIEVNGDEASAVNRSATLLALACSMRGDSPANYAIHVPAHDDLVSRVTGKAEELLLLGRGLFTSVSLSPRENEILIELLHNRVNKEIADCLNISVRTVKYHVSSLLNKFGVRSRWDLTQKAAQILGACAPAIVEPPGLRNSTPGREVEKRATEPPWRARANERVIPFRRNLRPA